MVNPATGALVGASPMPVRKKAKPAEVCLDSLVEWVSGFLPVKGGGGAVVWVEAPLKHAKSSQAVRSMSICYGMLVGALSKGLHLPVIPVEVKDWQDVVLGKFPPGLSKKVALERADALEPGVGERRWTAPRGRTPHNGIVDAYLIARYGLAGVSPDRKEYARLQRTRRPG